MTMTHKEALKFAQDAYYGGLISKWDPKNDKYMEAAIRAYIEARGLVLVQKGDFVTRESALDAIAHVEQFNGTGRAAQAIAMLSAAPYPFAIDTEDGK